MNTLSRRCVKPSSGTTDLNTKSSEMLVTRKGPKTKFHQMIRSKTKVKGTSENANRKKQGPDFNSRQRKNSRRGAHGVRTAEGVSWPLMRHHKLVSFSSYLSPKPLGLSYALVLSPGPKCPRECPLAAPARLGQPPARFPESPARAVAGGGPPSASPWRSFQRAGCLRLCHFSRFPSFSSPDVCLCSIFPFILLYKWKFFYILLYKFSIYSFE